MQKKYNRAFLSAIGAFLGVAIISTIVPLIYDIVFVIRHVSYFLTISTFTIFILYYSYLELIKKYNSKTKILMIQIWTVIVLIVSLFAITQIQNTYIKNNELVSHGCIYLDDYGNTIYKDELDYSCSSPTVVSKSSNEMVLQFHESKTGKIDHFIFDDLHLIDSNEGFEVTRDILATIQLTYDEEQRLIFYQADVVSSNIIFYNQAYYHTYLYDRFQMSQVFEEAKTTSTQVTYSIPKTYLILDEPQILQGPLMVEELALSRSEIYEISFVQESDESFDFEIQKSTQQSYSSTINHQFMSGTINYNDQGYLIEANEVIEEDVLIRKINISKQHDELEIVNDLYGFAEYGITYKQSKDDYMQKQYKSIYNDGEESIIKYSYYSPSEGDYRVSSQLPFRNYYNIAKEDYGKRTSWLIKNSTRNFDYELTFQSNYRNTYYDYINMLYLNETNRIYSPNHPIIKYADMNQPN